MRNRPTLKREDSLRSPLKPCFRPLVLASVLRVCSSMDYKLPLRPFHFLFVILLTTNGAFALEPISLTPEELRATVTEILKDEIRAGRIFVGIDPQQATIAQALSRIPSSEASSFLETINDQVVSQIANAVVPRIIQNQAHIFHDGVTHEVMNTLPFFSSIRDYFRAEHGVTFEGDVLIVKAANTQQWLRITGGSSSSFESAGITIEDGMLASRQAEVASLLRLPVKISSGSQFALTVRFYGFNQLLRAAQKHFYGSTDVLYISPGISFATPIEQASLLHEARHLVDLQEPACAATHCNEFERLEAIEIQNRKSEFVQKVMNSRAFREYQTRIVERFAQRIGKSVNEARRLLESNGVFASLVEAQWSYYADRQRLLERRAEFDEIHYLKTVHNFTPDQILEAKAKGGTGIRLEISKGNVFEIPGLASAELQRHELELYNATEIPQITSLKSSAIHSLCSRVLSLIGDKT